VAPLLAGRRLIAIAGSLAFAGMMIVTRQA
jgi:hypothetical protein